MKRDSRQIGVVAVDSGTVLVGDPCYWLVNEEYDREVCKPKFDTSREVKFERGHEGKGVIVSSGYGDGCYPVIATFKNGKVKELRIKFF